MRLELSGTDFYLSLSDLTEDMSEGLTACYTPGHDASDAVAAFLASCDVVCDPALAVAYLRPYGAWDDEELADHDANLARLVWLIGCDLADNGEAYLSAY